jgi:hypothetical protein
LIESKSVGETARMTLSSRAPARLALALSLFALAPAAAAAVELEIGPIVGFQQTGNLGTREGTLELEGGLLYGVNFGWRVRPDGLLEIAWSRQESEASGDLTSGPQDFEVTIDTVEIAGIWETRPGDMRPFLGMALGASSLAGEEQDFGDHWNFSGAIFGGVRYLLGEHAVVRLEGRGSGILLSESGAISCSYPPGVCRAGLSGSLLGALSARVLLSARF